MNSLDTALIKRAEENYEAMDWIEQGGGLPTSRLLLVKCLI